MKTAMPWKTATSIVMLLAMSGVALAGQPACRTNSKTACATATAKSSAGVTPTLRNNYLPFPWGEGAQSLSKAHAYAAAAMGGNGPEQAWFNCPMWTELPIWTGPLWKPANEVLGLVLSPTDAALKAHVGDGLLVNEVRKDSPLRQWSLKQYDVLKKLDGQDLCHVQDLENVIAQLAEAKEARLDIVRGGKHLAANVCLPKKKPIPPVEPTPPASPGLQTSNAVPGPEAVPTASVSVSVSNEVASLALTSADGVYFKLSLSYRTDQGVQKRRLAGTAKELLPQLDTLPPAVANLVRQQLRQVAGPWPEPPRPQTQPKKSTDG